MAVGDHILLGGDNMDLTLAYAVQAKLAQQGTTLDSWQFRTLSPPMSQGQGASAEPTPILRPNRW